MKLLPLLKRKYKVMPRKLNDFDVLKRAVAALRKAKPRSEGRPRKQRRMEARRKLLPQDRTCKHCGKPVLSSRSWVLKNGPGTKFEGCRKCYYRKVVYGDGT